jgi:hypothetical protein
MEDDQILVWEFGLAGKWMHAKRDRMCACIHAQRSPDWQRFVQPTSCAKLLSSSRSKHRSLSLSLLLLVPHRRDLFHSVECVLCSETARARMRETRERERERERKTRERDRCVVDGCTLGHAGSNRERERSFCVVDRCTLGHAGSSS